MHPTMDMCTCFCDVLLSEKNQGVHQDVLRLFQKKVHVFMYIEKM